MNKVTNHICREEISELTPERFVREYQKPGMPVVIKGLLADCEDWSLDYLCQELSSQEFLSRWYGNQRYKLDKRQWQNIGSGVQTKSLPFTTYAEMLRNHTAHEQDIYLAKCSLKDTSLEEKASRIKIGEKLGLEKPASDLNMWAGPGGHVEALHYDTLDGTLMQLHGAKKVVLFPSSQTANLYPFPVSVHLHHGLKLRSWFSQVYPEKPDLQAFPKLREALQYKQEVILHQGETLFIPAGWWHEVTALGNEMVCSVNRFWGVYPVERAIFSYSAWRTYLGILLAMPYMLTQGAIALTRRDRKQRLAQLWRML
ncbi:MAG: cupin-like domain-containing protein [Hormoscilla sp. SP5CHS1]|nr:cupin-like domain-containing protein [Hormoscilla sp. SP12CHS1]MBC6455588.1 cupin-like domain-containing protein [Hormoscilla sp. SP5CHS1]